MSIFFELPYWEHNTLRHNLDIMHIEKNVCDNVLRTLMNENGKFKDDEYARSYVESKNVKPYFGLNVMMKVKSSTCVYPHIACQ